MRRVVWSALNSAMEKIGKRQTVIKPII